VRMMCKRTLPLKVCKQTEDIEFNKSGDKMEEKNRYPSRKSKKGSKEKSNLISCKNRSAISVKSLPIPQSLK
jgi:hypothetical protein